MRSKKAKEINAGDVVDIEGKWRRVDRVVVFDDEVGIYTDGVTKGSFTRYPNAEVPVR